MTDIGEGDYVVRTGTEKPVGVVEHLFSTIGATVRWGVADGKTFREDLPLSDLELSSYQPEPSEVPEVLHKNVFEKNEEEETPKPHTWP